MFRWTKTWLGAWGADTTDYGEDGIRRTIGELQHCRRLLTHLLEETRLARQLLIVTEAELSEELGRVKAAENTLTPETFTQEHRQREASHG